MKRIFGIFKIKTEERWPALVMLVYTLLLNGLVIHKYFNKFSELATNYHEVFVRTFHISGFDALSYEVVSSWDTAYNIYRHPLPAFFMFIPNQINQGLILLTGLNCTQFVMAALLVCCGFYSFIFLYRILQFWLHHGHHQCTRSFCTFHVAVTIDTLCGRQENEAQSAVYKVANHCVFHPHGRHFIKQWHKGFPCKLVHKRSSFLASSQSVAGYSLAIGYHLGLCPHGMEPL